MMVSLLCALLLIVTVSAHAARIELIGFESGSNIECTSGTGGTNAIQSTVVYTGTYALETAPVTTAVGYCSIGIIGATGASAGGGGTGTLYTVFRFRAATLPASGQEDIFVAEGQSSSFKLYVRITSTGNLQAYDSTNTQLGSNGATTLSTGTWYLIGVKVGHGASGAYEVQIDGATELSGTGNLSTNAHNTRTFGKRVNTSGQTVDFFYDDIVVDDAAFPAGNRVVALHPNANGSTMQWINGSGASNYTQVDEVIPSTADFVQSAAQNDVALFQCENLPSTLTTPIPAIKAMLRVSEVASTTTIFAIRIRSSSTNSDSSTADAGSTAYATRSRLLELDPNGAAAWTVSAVNAVEAGGVDTGTNRLKIAWVALMVEAAPVTAAPATVSTRISVY